VGFFSRGGEARWGELRRRPGDDAAVSKDLTALLAGGRVREGQEPRVGEPVGFCDANF